MCLIDAWIRNNSKKKYDDSFENAITTEITKLVDYYKAENYHQKYIQKRN